MLVLSRLPGERIFMSGGIVITVVEIRINGGVPKVRLGFEAPQTVNIAREEVRHQPPKDRSHAKTQSEAAA